MQVITRSQSLLQVAVTHAILTYPEVQISKGHNEPDEVVGSAHLSVLGDIPSLPYICLMAKQTPRWSLTVPFGVSHATSPRLLRGRNHTQWHSRSQFRTGRI